MNLPNKISLTRILIIPIIIAIYVIDAIPCGKLIATILFALAAYTDFIDGMIARKTNQVTNMGKFLDESADKLLTTGALLLILQDAIIPVPFGVVAVFIILARDQIVSLLRRLATQKGITIAADKWGKMKTVVFDIFPILTFVKSVLRAAPIDDINGIFLSKHHLYSAIFDLIVSIASITKSGFTFISVFSSKKVL